MPWDRLHAMMQVNMVALSALTHLFLPDFVARNSGRILNVSSTASFVPGPLQAVYFATKAYVTFLGNAIAEELHKTKVTVTTLMPGATESEFAATSDMDRTSLFNKTTPASTVAQEGYEAMMKGELNVLSGVSARRRLLLKVSPVLPRCNILKQVREMQEIH